MNQAVAASSKESTPQGISRLTPRPTTNNSKALSSVMKLFHQAVLWLDHAMPRAKHGGWIPLMV
ncbi:MAG: hypothetical protein CBD47_05375 [Synechococcus sp. TMED187]|nr:MAG: hypothetical protein CBD47_05375 [Synechococcus sp. TMED187]